ncbi:MAG: P-II family nitrogen regulator [Actinomycetota bacterium]
MIKVEAIIRQEKLSAIKDALEEKGVSGMTIEDVQGRGRQKGIQLEWRVGKYNVEFLPKIKLEIICKDSECEDIIDTIIESARTGEVGDGKIFISEIKDIVRVRTGERGEIAI